METTDISILRLQYEILNVSLESIASQAGISLPILKDIAEKDQWEHKWIDPDNPEPESEFDEGSEFDEDPLTVQSEQFIDRSKKRLAAYSIAKNILLAQKYLELEVSIVNKTIQHLNDRDPATLTPRDLKSLSNIFSSMIKGTPLADIISLASKEEEGGIPLLVMKDLAGS